jgi:hypothetical protein
MSIRKYKPTELFQGTLDLLILKALVHGELHGLAIAHRVEANASVASLAVVACGRENIRCPQKARAPVYKVSIPGQTPERIWAPFHRSGGLSSSRFLDL